MKTKNKASFISFCSWNVGGLITEKGNKLHDQNFIDQITKYYKKKYTMIPSKRPLKKYIFKLTQLMNI
jgi:hypothetical protein